MHKDTNIFSELQEFFQQNDSHRAIFSIYRMMNGLRIDDSTIGIKKAKNRQYTPIQVLHLLILFPFFVIKDASQYSSSALARLFGCERDVFYRLLRDDNIDWQSILYRFNMQVIKKIAARSDNKKYKRPVCLVADDTDLPKTGRCIENIGRIHSHVENRSILGFKGLFLARTDGKTQTVLDFSLHGEEGKNPDKPQGMSVKLFFCRRGRHGNWNGLLTTDTALGFFEAYKIYAMRWSIEVCFSEMKGVLRLGKCQARNFTEQVSADHDELMFAAIHGSYHLERLFSPFLSTEKAA